MLTRQQYLDTPSERQAIAHRAYYAQFINQLIVDLVLRHLGRERIVTSQDPHFNDIPLKRWDMMVPNLPFGINRKLAQYGDNLSLSTGVCILKEAAQQIREAQAHCDMEAFVNQKHRDIALSTKVE